jgi:hypothetical protein
MRGLATSAEEKFVCRIWVDLMKCVIDNSMGSGSTITKSRWGEREGERRGLFLSWIRRSSLRQ